MTATSGTTLLDQLIDEIPGLGIKFTGTATAAGQVVTTDDPRINRGGANLPATAYQGRFLYIPAETGDDQVHSVTTASAAAATGITTITTLDTYDSTTTDGTMYLLAIHPDTIRNLFNDGLDLEYTDWTLPITDVTDGDIQTSGVTNWSDTNATSSKVTAAGNVLYGIRGLRVLNSGANGYTATAAASRIVRGQSFRAWAFTRADVGTSVFTVVDTSGNSLGSASYSEENPGLIYVDINPGTSVEEIKFRLGGSGASDDTYWFGVGFYRPDSVEVKLPSFADERFKVKAISTARYKGSTDSSAYQAQSRQLARLTEGDDWRYINEYASVNALSIELTRTGLLQDMPLFITASVPFSYFGTLTTDADTSTCPIQVWKERCKLLIGERYARSFPDLAAKMEKVQAAHNARVAVRENSPPKWETRVRRMFS